jgi:hypothetical protein
MTQTSGVFVFEDEGKGADLELIYPAIFTAS